MWAAAKPRPSQTVTAVGEYPSDRRQPWKTAEPVLTKVLKAQARRNERALRVLSTALKPQTFPRPPIELLPSTETRYPRSLTHWHLVQIEGQAWPRPGASAIWNVVVQRNVRTHFPEHDLRALKPQVWRRGLDALKLTGLQGAGTRKPSLSPQRPAHHPDELMTPSWREARIQESAISPRIPAANLTRTDAVRCWLPQDAARGSVAPLRLLASKCAISVPDPKPLR